jgi:hypothetical protein
MAADKSHWFAKRKNDFDDISARESGGEPPQSRRFANATHLTNRAKRLDCGCFSTAFERATRQLVGKGIRL